jgi:DNA-binding NarL/FixJ family response regulator
MTMGHPCDIPDRRPGNAEALFQKWPTASLKVLFSAAFLENIAFISISLRSDHFRAHWVIQQLVSGVREMIRLLVADDHQIFRQGLTRLLSDHADMIVAAEAANYGEVVEALRAHSIDVAIIDLSMPGRSGVELISHAKKLQASMRVLVMTMHGDEPYVTQALRAGADGYMTKEHAADELVMVIRRLAKGGRYICSSVAEKIALGIGADPHGEVRHSRLTERELKIFEMLVAGRRGWEIAQELSLSEKTVSTHKAHVLKKMNVTNRTELVLYAIRHQLVAV